jgi:eukaryotic-like serine/threonine-protein kinase
MDDLRDAVQASVGRSYILERELGGGGMSRVFLARDTALDRPVVVKVLLPELASGVSARRFAREVRAAATLQHPHIVSVLFAGHTADEIPFYVMPYVQGETLRQRMDRGPIRFVEASEILGDVAKALAAAHEVALVHRDVKPDNILLCGGAAVVADFGIAHAMHDARVDSADSRLTTHRTSLGTPAYLAPEQAVGDAVDARTDVYSWGVVGYEMIAGHHPFPRANTTQKLIAAHIAERPRPLSPAGTDSPAWFCDLIMSCLSKDPVDRPADGAALLRALERGGMGRGSILARYRTGVIRLFGGVR